MKRNLVLSIAAVLLFSAIAVSGCGEQVKPAAEYRDPSMQAVAAIPVERQYTLDDLLLTRYVSSFIISPDGSLLAWVMAGHAEGGELESGNLFVTDLASRETRQVTDFREASLSEPQWSPDGKTLAWLSNAPLPGEGTPGGPLQVWAAGAGAWQPRPVTRRAGGVGDFDWRGSDSIVFYAEEPDAESAGAADDTVHVSDYAEFPVNLYQVGLEGGEAGRLTGYPDNMTHLSTSPDGRYAFLVRTGASGFYNFTGSIPFHNYLLDLETGEARGVLKETREVYGARWSPDSRTLYVVDNHSEDEAAVPVTCLVRTLDAASGEEGLVDLDWGRGLDSMTPTGYSAPVISPTRDGFVAILADGCHPRAARYVREGGVWKREMLEAEHQGNIFSITVSSDGRTACYDYSTASEPPQLYAATLDGAKVSSPVQLTRLNPGFEEKGCAPAEAVTWEGALGEEVEGMLYYPSGYQPGRRYPLVLMIHGGPFSCDRDRWPVSFYNWTNPYRLFTQKGAFVLSPNYHGSCNYGETSADFGGSIANRKFYEYPLEDIEKAIDRLVELGMVDEGRLATQGWSNGSLLSNGLIATDGRFKAASCGAGGAEWVNLWGSCTARGDKFVRYFFGSDPIEDPDTFKDPALMPFYDAGKVVTPTIIFSGDEDVNVPTAMTWVTYRGLQLHGRAPVELYLFPGEEHVLSKLTHKRRKLTEEQAWFDRYLFSD